jgi:hypothetical protein
LSATGFSGGFAFGAFALEVLAGRMEELAGAGSVARGALGLNGWLRDRMCQLAIRILRATAALAGLGRAGDQESGALLDKVGAGAGGEIGSHCGGRLGPPRGVLLAQRGRE